MESTPESGIPHLADDYVSDFDLHHLEEVVKQEMEARAKMANACLPPRGTPTSTPAIVQQQGGGGQAEPDYAAGSGVTGSALAPCVGKASASLPLTPRTPGSPADTPNLPSPSGYPPATDQQQMTNVQGVQNVQKNNSSLLEDMLWFTQNMRYNGLTQEPLDLHVRNHDGQAGGQAGGQADAPHQDEDDRDWTPNNQHPMMHHHQQQQQQHQRKDAYQTDQPMTSPSDHHQHLHDLQSPRAGHQLGHIPPHLLQQHHSNSASGHPVGGHLGHHHHHHHLHHDQDSLDDDDDPPLTLGGIFGHHQSQSLRGGCSNGSADELLDDDQLMSLTVRELNKRLHGYPREDVVRLKQKRRTLKNRGYAQNCRSKRLQQRHELEGQNRVLQSEVMRLRQEVSRVAHERDAYKQRLDMIRGQRNGSRGSMSSVNSSPSSPEFYM